MAVPTFDVQGRDSLQTRNGLPLDGMLWISDLLSNTVEFSDLIGIGANIGLPMKDSLVDT